MQYFIRTVVVLSVFAGAVAVAQTPSETTFVRELAKNKARVLIVTSGPIAVDMARQLQTAILTHPDNKHVSDDVPVIALDQADALVRATDGSKQTGMSTITLIATDELTGGNAAAAAAAVHIPPGANSNSIAEISAARSAGANRGLTFTITLLAPDRDCLSRLVGLLVQRKAARFEELPFHEEHPVNRVAVFSAPEDRGAVDRWGALPAADVWNEIAWNSIDDTQALTNTRPPGSSEAFFFDRSRRNTPGQPPTKILVASTLSDVAVMVQRSELDGGGSKVVFSLPNGKVLAAKARRFPNIPAVPVGTTLTELQDLRHLGTTTLRVWGVGPTADEKEQIRATLASDMLSATGLPVGDVGEVAAALGAELPTEELVGASATARALRTQIAVRYLWIYRITGYGGSTEFKATERPVTSLALPTYEQSHPNDVEPQLVILSQGGGKADEIARKKPIFDRDHAAWLKRRSDFDNSIKFTMPVQWQRVVMQSATAQVSGTLQLVDLKSSADAGRVVWEQASSGTVAASPVLASSDQVVVRGVAARPPLLPVPPAQSSCPANLLLDAAHRAFADAVASLVERALVSGDSATLVTGTAGTAPSQPPNAQTPAGNSPLSAAPTRPDGVNTFPLLPGPKVALVEPGAVVLKIDPQAGLKVGDMVEIALRMVAVPDPDDATKVLRWDTTDRITMRVTRVVNNTADCVMANPADAARVAQIKPGMPAVILKGGS